MAALRRKALRPGWGHEPWTDEQAFVAVSNPAYRSREGLTVELRASIADVQKVLARALKPGKRLLTVVQFTSGRMEEVSELEAVAEVESPTARPTPELATVTPDPPPIAQVEDKPKAAATIAKPTIGCPQPVFLKADVRAARVLEAFLTPEQREDFRHARAFVALGADTGHRYLITDRERPNPQHPSYRSLFDIDEGRALCVHDWDVPPPEEMLALLLCVSLPGRESYVRHLPETWH